MHGVVKESERYLGELIAKTQIVEHAVSRDTFMKVASGDLAEFCEKAGVTFESVNADLAPLELTICPWQMSFSFRGIGFMLSLGTRFSNGLESMSEEALLQSAMHWFAAAYISNTDGSILRSEFKDDLTRENLKGQIALFMRDVCRAWQGFIVIEKNADLQDQRNFSGHT